MNQVPPIEPKTVMDHIDDGVMLVKGVNRRMMWLFLQALHAQINGKARIGDVKDFILSEDGSATDEEIEFFEDFGASAPKSLLSSARRDLIAYGLVEMEGHFYSPTNLGLIISNESELHFFTRDEAAQKTESEPWQDEVVRLMHGMTPDDFEEFVGKVLAKAGMFDLEITGKSGDGGIDGHGSMVNGFVSVPAFFQAKRYSGSVSASQVRDFRGAIQGRGHIGFIVTTGTFSKDAHQEAERTQSVSITLVDGVALAEWMKSLRLGVKVTERVVEDVEIDEEWWAN